jgi:hypothetical protein
MRLKELGKVFTYFSNAFAHLEHNHHRKVGQVREKLKTATGTDILKPLDGSTEIERLLETYSVYGFVCKIEEILIGPHENRAHGSGSHTPKVVNAPHKPREVTSVDSVDWDAEFQGFVSGFKNVFRLSGSHETEWTSEIKKMLDGAHEKIRKRQKKLAEELMVLRNAELEKWNRALQDGSGRD